MESKAVPSRCQWQLTDQLPRTAKRDSVAVGGGERGEKIAQGWQSTYPAIRGAVRNILAEWRGEASSGWEKGGHWHDVKFGRAARSPDFPLSSGISQHPNEEKRRRAPIRRFCE